MASPEESPESWEYTLSGEEKKTGAVGTRDVLILVSSESGDEDIMARKKGELTQQDKDRLSSEGISKDCWEDDVMIMKERFSKHDRIIKSIKIEDTHLNTKYVLSQITDLFKNTTAPGDQNGVQPCGHSAKKWNQIESQSSCQPDQIGSSLVYSARGQGNDKNTGVNYVWASITVAPDQNSTSRDFTEITCEKSPEEECALIPNYTFQEERKRSRMYTVRGVDHGRPVWHIALLVDDPETIRSFKEKAQGENSRTQTVSINDYGVSIKSGWGQEPPQEVKDWVARIQEGIEDLPPY